MKLVAEDVEYHALPQSHVPQWEVRICGFIVAVVTYSGIADPPYSMVMNDVESTHEYRSAVTDAILDAFND